MFGSSVRGQIIYIFSFANMYLKLTCHLPFARKGFLTGCVRQVAGRVCSGSRHFYTRSPVWPGRALFTDHRQLTNCVSGLQPLGLGKRLAGLGRSCLGACTSSISELVALSPL